MSANDRQVAGTHYQKNVVRCKHCGGILQHWDIYKWFPYLVGQVSRYLWRWKDKNGFEDLEKSAHYMQKLVEEVQNEQPKDVAELIEQTDHCAPEPSGFSVSISVADFPFIYKNSAGEVLLEVMPHTIPQPEIVFTTDHTTRELCSLCLEQDCEHPNKIEAHYQIYGGQPKL